MELIDRLRQIAQELGYTLSDEELKENASFSEDMEEHIFLGEADMVASELSSSISEMLRLNQFSGEAKRSCAMLRALVLARCANESLELAAEVERRLKETAEIYAPSLVVLSAPGSTLTH